MSVDRAEQLKRGCGWFAVIGAVMLVFGGGWWIAGTTLLVIGITTRVALFFVRCKNDTKR